MTRNRMGAQYFDLLVQAEDGIRDATVTGVQTCVLPIQAEDGIRDATVTGVQTCALPIDRKSTRLNSSHGSISYASSVSLDRKSTRLNSSHGSISYAVFCLKKKKCDLPLAQDADGPLERPVLGARADRGRADHVVGIDRQALARRGHVLVASLNQLSPEREVGHQARGEIVSDVAEVVERVPLDPSPQLTDGPAVVGVR